MHRSSSTSPLRFRWLLAAFAAGLLLTATGAVYADRDDHPRAKQKFQVGLWGDMPYNLPEDAEVKVPALIDDMNSFHLAFTVFDGDTKNGSSLCSDAALVDLPEARFNSVQSPTVYVPGDNEWTDCHRNNNGGYDNLERLDFLRANMFDTVDSFGQTKMALEHQGELGEAYSENTRWMFGGIVFVGLNVPGSNNNHILDFAACDAATNSARTLAQCEADEAEYLERDAQNIDWLNDSFDLAREKGAPGIMIVIQADMGFDLPETSADERADPGSSGYTNFIAALVAQAQDFDGEVVLIHGDTHFFKVDKPFVDGSGALVPNITRVETFGEDNVHWVKATIDPNSRNVFTFEPMIVAGN